MKITLSGLHAICQHGLAGYPEEICGFLIGRRNSGIVTRVESARNITPSAVQYTIDPVDHLRVLKQAQEEGLAIIGYYHSHPNMGAFASVTDTAKAWPGFFYLILGLRRDRPVEAKVYLAVEAGGTMYSMPLELSSEEPIWPKWKNQRRPLFRWRKRKASLLEEVDADGEHDWRRELAEPTDLDAMDVLIS